MKLFSFRTIQLPNISLPQTFQERSSARWLLYISLGWLTLFFFLPVIWLLFESLNFDGGSVFANYETALGAVYLRALARTFLYAAITTLVTLVLGYVLAYYVVFLARRRLILLLFIALPLWVALVIRYFGIQLIFLPTGPVELMFDTDFGILFSTTGVVLGLTSALLPFAILPMYSSLQSIDEELVGAASVLGATRLQTFRKVILPLSIPGVVAAGLLVFILAAGSFLAPALLGAPSDFMMANVIEEAYGTRTSVAAALSLIFTVALLALILLFNWVVNIGEVLGSL
ncbi:spermidine/putrescine transport system permease protein [Natronorubrum sediminis]|uniref:Spermidine/putrescine transport system permease protein n=1 Tax=Natronorubrum sediminis TaxID=640943 RepID=A0A1H6FUK5_9EURY|nr:ABC transporter permease [Natronorubrum sediminis]SEH14459.1 spermidine/putrescine transport system permease protein [Natronorubrum sediminis]